MAENHNVRDPSVCAAEHAPLPLPAGYRQGIITAITVLPGFSLTFFRFWGFEAPGQWTRALGRLYCRRARGRAAATGSAVPLALRLEDDNAIEYRKTVVWFIASAIALVLGLLFAVFGFSGVLK